MSLLLVFPTLSRKIQSPSPFSELSAIKHISALAGMGRTTPTTTELVRIAIEEWKPFRNALPKSERKQFDDVLKSALHFNSAMMMSVAEHPVPIQRILMSIVFHHYKQLHEMKSPDLG